MPESNLVKDINGIYTKTIENPVFYPEAGNESCFAVEKGSFWFNNRNSIIREIILKFPFTGNFADIGGGNGYQADFIKKTFPEKEVFLIEPGYQGCLNAIKYGLKNVYNVPFQDFDFVGKNVNGVGLFDVVEHIPDDVAFLSGISSCLPKGSFIFMTVPAYKFLWSDTDDHADHFRRYTSNMIKKLAHNANLQVVHNGYFMSYLTLPIFLGRSLPYKIRGKRNNEKLLDEALKNHEAGALSGKVLKLLNNIELGIIRNFGKIPFGGSCIAVFRT